MVGRNLEACLEEPFRLLESDNVPAARVKEKKKCRRGGHFAGLGITQKADPLSSFTRIFVCTFVRKGPPC